MIDELTITAEEDRQNFMKEIMVWVREGRDKRLSATDYIFLPDVTVTQSVKDTLITYRQELRDFPEGFSTELSAMTIEDMYLITPHSIVYPVKPEL